MLCSDITFIKTNIPKSVSNKAHICSTCIYCNNSEKVLQVIYLSIQVQILGERCLYNCKLFSSKCAPGDSKQKAHKEFNESPKQTKDLISNSLSGLRLLEEKLLCMLYPSVLGLLCTKKTPMMNIKGFAYA